MKVAHQMKGRVQTEKEKSSCPEGAEWQPYNKCNSSSYLGCKAQMINLYLIFFFLPFIEISNDGSLFFQSVIKAQLYCKRDTDLFYNQPVYAV